MTADLPLPPATFPTSEQNRDTNDNQKSKRRRFQVPITRYFNASEIPSSIVPDESTLSPPLPQHVQSNLLTVGMRIRKSVPEGYKTMLVKQSMITPHVSASSSDATPFSDSTSYNELSPYCGLHKIGGMAVQPLPQHISNTSAAGFSSAQSSITLSAAEQEEDPFSFPSSQESTISTASSIQPHSGRNKRVFDDEVDEDEQQTHNPYDHFSTNPTGMLELNSLMRLGQGNSSTSRMIAKPRSRRNRGLHQQQSQAHEMFRKSFVAEGQENFMGNAGSFTHGFSQEPEFDFGEAAFLSRREDVDMDMEM